MSSFNLISASSKTGINPELWEPVKWHSFPTHPCILMTALLISHKKIIQIILIFLSNNNRIGLVFLYDYYIWNCYSLCRARKLGRVNKTIKQSPGGGKLLKLKTTLSVFLSASVQTKRVQCHLLCASTAEVTGSNLRGCVESHFFKSSHCI